ncbi:MAG: hypothetical protein LIP10_04205 [Clostridiales bacterium]|nr:hypothetical protein [Clostridiales bacterium]
MWESFRSVLRGIEQTILLQIPRWFVLMLVINTLVSLLYLILGLILRRKKEGAAQYLINTVVMLLCPVVGPLFYIFGTFFRHALMRREVDLSDVMFSKQRIHSLLLADVEKESNLVPMEEALAVSDKASLRGLMLNVIRGDIQNSLASIALALNSEDSETSHYAASVLRDQLNDFRAYVQKLYTQIKEAREAGEGAAEEAALLITYMDQVLAQHVFTGLEQETFVREMDEVCEILYQEKPGAMESDFCESVVLRLTEIGEYDRAEEWCGRAITLYPEQLSSYTSRMKLYFSAGWKEKFFAALEEIRHSDIVIDNETLELIRMFSA